MTERAAPAETPGVVACVAYEDGRRVGDLPLADVSEAIGRPGQFVWIGLYEPSEELLAQVQEEFGLHDLAVEDAHHAHQRAKLERYGDSLFVALRTARLVEDGHGIVFGETHVFVGPRYVVSVRHGRSRPHAAARARCEADPDLLRHGPGFVLYALLDFVVDQYLPVVEALEADLDAIEARIFDGRPGRETTERLYELKRDLLNLQRSVLPLVDVTQRLARGEEPLVAEPVRPYLRDVADHCLRLAEMAANLRELLATALDANLSLIAVNQNEDMKRLAGWAAILAVPTLVAGIYGMNFENMPELHWPLAYPAALAGMALACGALYVAFRRSGWL
ncbi:MAG: magnesium/cobalt transporter CorA [Acidobacteriota bacterium]